MVKAFSFLLSFDLLRAKANADSLLAYEHLALERFGLPGPRRPVEDLGLSKLLPLVLGLTRVLRINVLLNRVLRLWTVLQRPRMILIEQLAAGFQLQLGHQLCLLLLQLLLLIPRLF